MDTDSSFNSYFVIIDEDPDYSAWLKTVLEEIFPAITVFICADPTRVAVPLLRELDKPAVFLVAEKFTETEGLNDGLNMIDFIRKSYRFPSFCYLMTSDLTPKIRNRSLKFGKVRPLEKRPKGYDNRSLLRYYEGEMIYALDQLKEKLIDALTGLYTRTRGMDVWEYDFNHAVREKHSIGCLWIDVDSLKQINATYHYEIGDVVLIRVAEVLKKKIRNAFDTATRWGGDEFVVFFPNVRKEELGLICKRIEEGMSEIKVSIGKGRWFTPTVSIGEAIITPRKNQNSDIELNSLKEIAEQAMARRKLEKKGIMTPQV